MLDCSFYKAVGTAIQDVFTADMVVKRARELGIGTEVDMTED
jgi:ornithine cyclodeaminase/alanine dehydrogenase-like protein (mu-crystallin family)